MLGLILHSLLVDFKIEIVRYIQPALKSIFQSSLYIANSLDQTLKKD
jgi:hypothetical protein